MAKRRGWKQVLIRLDEDGYARVREAAFRRGQKMQDVMEELVMGHLPPATIPTEQPAAEKHPIGVDQAQ